MLYGFKSEDEKPIFFCGFLRSLHRQGKGTQKV